MKVWAKGATSGPTSSSLDLQGKSGGVEKEQVEDSWRGSEAWGLDCLDLPM